MKLNQMIRSEKQKVVSSNIQLQYTFQMDFFKDFSDLSNTPVYSKYNQQSAKLNKNAKLETKSNKGMNDDFDDLLDNLMSKQQTKKSRRNIEPYSSQNLGPATGLDSLAKTTDKFNNFNTESDINYNYGLVKGGNKGSRKSILDDLMSDDNKSYKSGATGRRDNKIQDNSNIVRNIQPANNQLFQPGASGRSAMRPPLKKKAQSREPSVFNDDKSVSRFNDNMGSIDNLDIISVTPKMPKRHTMQPEHTDQSHNQIKFDLTASKQKLMPNPGIQFSKPIVQEKIVQKIVHIKQDNKEVTQRHQEELKLIKQSYQRQINSLKQSYEKLINDQQQTRKLMMKNYEENIDSEKKKWDKILHNEIERVKSLFEWQNKKKTQSYEHEVRKLRELLQTITKSEQKRNKQQKNHSNTHESTLEWTMKLKQLEKQKQKLEQQKIIMEAKRRQFQSEGHQFQLYRRRQQSKLNEDKKKLFEYETQIRKRQVQTKKQFLFQKQSLATEMVNNELTLTQARQNIRHELQKLSLQRDLFSQQKMQYQKINNKILSDLKQRQKALQFQREELNNLQIELYKKLNTIEMMAVQKGLSNNKNVSLGSTIGKNAKRSQSVNRSISYYEQNHKENYRNRVNSQLDSKIADTKSRYAQMQTMARDSSHQKQSFSNHGTKIHLEKYIEKLSRDKLKLQKC